MRGDKISRLLKPALISGLAAAVNASCAPNSEIGNIVQSLYQVVANPTGVYVPTYPPYVIEEPEQGNSRYPTSVLEWDDTDNADVLSRKSCSDGKYATINGTSSRNYVENGVIVQFDHDIKGEGNDLVLHLNGDYSNIDTYYAVYLVFPKNIVFKAGGNKKPRQISGWDKYDFYLIYAFNGRLTGDAFYLDARNAIEEAGRSSKYAGIFNYGTTPVRVSCLIDRHVD